MCRLNRTGAQHNSVSGQGDGSFGAERVDAHRDGYAGKRNRTARVCASKVRLGRLSAGIRYPAAELVRTPSTMLSGTAPTPEGSSGPTSLRSVIQAKARALGGGYESFGGTCHFVCSANADGAAAAVSGGRRNPGRSR